MPRADPAAAAEYNRARWRSHGHIYRASRTPAQPPISRQQVLDEDAHQAAELARLEARRIGHQRAQARLAAWLAAERRWIRLTTSPFVLGGLDEQRT